MDKETKADVWKMTQALMDQTTIQQLSDWGKAARVKRETLKGRHRPGETAENRSRGETRWVNQPPGGVCEVSVA